MGAETRKGDKYWESHTWNPTETHGAKTTPRLDWFLSKRTRKEEKKTY